MLEKLLKKFGYVKGKLSTTDTLTIDVEANTESAIGGFAKLEAALDRVADKASKLLTKGSITYERVGDTETFTIKANNGTTSD